VNQDLSVKVLKATDMGRDGEFLLSYSSLIESNEGGKRRWEGG